MFLSKASVVLVSILGISWFTGDPFVSAGPLPQGYNQQMPQKTNQQMPPAPVKNQQMPRAPVYNQQLPPAPVYNQQMPPAPVYNQQMPPAPVYNQQMPPAPVYNQPMLPGYNQQMPQYQPPTIYYSNLQPWAPFVQPKDSKSDEPRPLFTWDSVKFMDDLVTDCGFTPK